MAPPSGSALPTPQTESLTSRIPHWLGVFAAYLFLAGWTFQGYYFKTYGLRMGWLDVGVSDAAARGFAVLFGTAWPLAVIYGFVVLVSLWMETIGTPRSRLLPAFATTALFLLFAPVYLLASRAGVAQANQDRGQNSTLPSVLLKQENCAYIGRLVYVKSELLYVQDLALAPAPASAPRSSCSPEQRREVPDSVDTASQGLPQLWMLRFADLRDVRVIQYERSAKP